MNLPNLITLSRIPLMFVIVGLMYANFNGSDSLAFWLFILCAIGDWLDGYLARKQGLISTFGKFMDALSDKIMVMGLVIALTLSMGELQLMWLILTLVTLSREFLVTGMRMVVAAKGVIVAADRGGKTKTLTQLISIGFLLGAPMAKNDWGRWFNFDLSAFAGILHLIGFYGFVLGTILAVWSGGRYLARYRKEVFSEDKQP